MQPRTVSLYEHQTCSYPDIGLLPDDPMFEQLDQINRLANKEIITLGRKNIQEWI